MNDDSGSVAELDIDELEALLRTARDALERKNYAVANRKVWIAWGDVQRFRLSLDDRRLPATTDKTARALIIKALYWWRNRHPLPCRALGYNCEWVYPYGFVPEGGCPLHD